MPQSLYARCPECATVFRVTEQLLSVAKGKVRCGACLHIFKATDHLVRPKQSPASNPSQSSASHIQQEKETSIARSADRLAAAIQASETISEANLLSAPATDQLAIHHSRKAEQAEYPIRQFGQSTAADRLASSAAENPDSKLVDEASDPSADPELALQPQNESEPDSQPLSLEAESDDWELDDTQPLGLESAELESRELDVIESEEPESQTPSDPFEPSLEEIEAFANEAPDAIEDDIADDDLECLAEQEKSAVPQQAAADSDDETLSLPSDLDSLAAPDTWAVEDVDENDFPQEQSLFEEEPSINQHAELEQGAEDGQEEDVALIEEDLTHQLESADESFDEEELQEDDCFQEEDFQQHDDEPLLDNAWYTQQTESENVESDANDEWLFDDEPTENSDSVDYDPSLEPLPVNLKSDVTEPDPLDEFDDIVAEKNHTYKWLALAGVILVGAIWGGIRLWQDRQTLAWDDTWGSLVQGMCAVFPCDLKPRRDVAAIELIQRDIGPSESDPDITEFSLVIRNNAAFAQPYPVVKIRFTDTRGEVVAEELHPPASYLAKDMVNTQMPSGQKVHIIIRAQESYAGAFGFEFSFQ
jgi:predicted Zn finger-like uncharacterized protein